MEYLHKLFGITMHGKSISSSLFINLFNDLFVLIGTHGHLSYTLDYNQLLLFILLLKLSQLW